MQIGYYLKERIYILNVYALPWKKGDGNGPMIQSGAYGDLGVVPAYKSLILYLKVRCFIAYIMEKDTWARMVALE